MNFFDPYRLFNPPDYICYNEELCDHDLFFGSSHSSAHIFNANSACRSFSELNIFKMAKRWFDLMESLNMLFRKCSNYYQLRLMSNDSNFYTCFNSSKIISQHRLVDMIQDCFYGDDESYAESCSLKNFNHRFKCRAHNRTICLAPISALEDITIGCTDLTDEQIKNDQYSKKMTWFPLMCDRYTELDPISIDGSNETDETDCNHFPCNNTYTRCDGMWNCIDGADEMNCQSLLNCPLMHHLCLSPITGNLTCLSIERVNDDIIDCLGATDERKFCHQSSDLYQSSSYRCWNSNKCITGINACSRQCPQSINISMSFCHDVTVPFSLLCSVEGRTLVDSFLCSLGGIYKANNWYLTLNASSFYAPTMSSIMSKLQ